MAFKSTAQYLTNADANLIAEFIRVELCGRSRRPS